MIILDSHSFQDEEEDDDDDDAESESSDEGGEEDEDPDHVLSYLMTSQRMSVVRRKERRMRIQTTGSHT